MNEDVAFPVKGNKLLEQKTKKVIENKNFQVLLTSYARVTFQSVNEQILLMENIFFSNYPLKAKLIFFKKNGFSTFIRNIK